MKKIFHPQMHNTHHILRIFFVIENVVILNYNICKLLKLTQKMKESLNTRVGTCLKDSSSYRRHLDCHTTTKKKTKALSISRVVSRLQSGLSDVGSVKCAIEPVIELATST